MKKTLSLILAILLLLSPIQSFATTTDSNQATTEEIRNQNIYVPTKTGVQRATYDEAVKIDELYQKQLMDLCKSYILGDYKSGKILESYNIDEVRAMASTSKLVSIYVVMDKISDGTIKKDDIVTIDHESAQLSGSTFKLTEGEQVDVWTLVKASLIVSGNDAITALGKYISGSTESFVNLMNEKCSDLGLDNAHMVNPTGLTNYAIEDYNKMTTREMFTLTRSLIRDYPEILEITSMSKLEDQDRNFLEYNTNPILGIVEGIDGLKTGYTNASGRCLIATGSRTGEDGAPDTRLIGIVTGSSTDWERYVAARRLLEDGFENYKYIVVGNTEEAVSTIQIEDSNEIEVDVFVKTSGTVLSDGSKIEQNISINEDLKAPIAAGEVVGSITYTMSGETIATSDLIIKQRVNEKGLLVKIRLLYENIFNNIKNAA